MLSKLGKFDVFYSETPTPKKKKINKSNWTYQSGKLII